MRRNQSDSANFRRKLTTLANQIIKMVEFRLGHLSFLCDLCDLCGRKKFTPQSHRVHRGRKNALTQIGSPVVFNKQTGDPI